MRIMPSIMWLCLTGIFVFLVFRIAGFTSNTVGRMTGDGIVVRLFLIVALLSPALIYYLYVSWRREPRATVQHMRGALLGALLATIVAAIVSAVAMGMQAGSLDRYALFGAMVFVGFYGIPSAIAGAVVGVERHGITHLRIMMLMTKPHIPTVIENKKASNANWPML